MTDLDQMLGRMRDAPDHPRLAGLDGRVMDELAGLRATPSPGVPMFGVAMTAALLIGVAASAWPSAGADARPASPFGPQLALAPSTLLEPQ